ncbi:MAG: amidohydrolase family protein [Dehalogenimonas sp.]|uniref:Amidohydrolase family protein n=1 Tax=Candidatus Dehalogenimonas loeffleri TaxID=3127115 RepID=A0ABZ2J919_9CHLR|nr:amidohydrolase family protein [Dehalogenimonas sp.]
MIIDVHTHVFSPEVTMRREEYAANDVCFAQLYGNAKAKLRTAEDLISEMEDSGVNKAVILNIGWGSHELCVRTNDYILEAASRYPDRLIPFVSVQPAAGQAALAELKRCAVAGARGLGELRPDVQGFDLNDRRLIKPLVKTLTDLGMVMTCHADEPVGHHYPGKGTLTPDVLFPFIEAHPGLRLILSHWGGGLPFYGLMPEVEKALTNVWFDSAASPFLYQPEIFERVSELVGADKILFGSDWPLLKQRRCLDELRATNLSTWSMRSISGGNAAGMLGLSE